MTIDCRTKGIAMRDGVRVDADGFHCFSLNEDRHNPFEVVERLMNACGAPADTPASAARYESIVVANRLGCKRTACPTVSECKQTRACLIHVSGD